MPNHLKVETGTADSNSLADPVEEKKKQSSSMPPRMRQPANEAKLQTIGTPDELNRMVDKSSPISDKQHRIASTGGSSLQNTEIIKSEVK